jgi:hypothetical protein
MSSDRGERHAEPQHQERADVPSPSSEALLESEIGEDLQRRGQRDAQPPGAATQTVTCLDCGAGIDTLYAYQYLTDAGFLRRPVCESCYTSVVTGGPSR